MRTLFAAALILVSVLVIGCGALAPVRNVQAAQTGDQRPAIASSAPLPESFGFGTPATPDVIAAIDIDVMPDGRGLPPGSGTSADGAPIYRRQCASCHGAEGEGGTEGRLVGPEPRTVGSYWPYATTLFDYINRAMPSAAPGSLSADQVYGLVAWILAKSDRIDEDTVMNAETLPRVEMPARDRFVPDDRRGGPEVR